MATVDPPTTYAASPSGLKVTMIVFSAIGLPVWGTSIAFLFGWESLRYYSGLSYGANISIIVNMAMIYGACRLIFLVTNSNFPNTAGMEDLHQCVARMVAFTVVGLSTWVTSVVWLVSYGIDEDHFIAHRPGNYTDDTDEDPFMVYHACNYGFVFSAVVAGLAGGLLSQVRVVRTPTSTGPVHAVNPIAPQPSPAYYNLAYVHHYGQQRV